MQSRMGPGGRGPNLISSLSGWHVALPIRGPSSMGPGSAEHRHSASKTRVNALVARRTGVRDTGPSGIARRVRLAEDVDGIAGLQVAPREDRIGVQRKVADRERADAVESPDRDTLHQVTAPRR